MKIKVNGKFLTDFSGNINELLQKQNLSSDRVAVEYNGQILSRENFNNVYLKDGDTVEIVHFVGGG